MLETIVVVLLILWLLGAFGSAVLPAIAIGGVVHVLLLIVVILVILRLLKRL